MVNQTSVAEELSTQHPPGFYLNTSTILSPKIICLVAFVYIPYYENSKGMNYSFCLVSLIFIFENGLQLHSVVHPRV